MNRGVPGTVAVTWVHGSLFIDEHGVTLLRVPTTSYRYNTSSPTTYSTSDYCCDSVTHWNVTVTDVLVLLQLSS